MQNVLFVKGRFKEELSFNIREILHENCALAAAINIENASQYVYDCLVMQEHRGEKGSGIASLQDGTVYYRRGKGLARNALKHHVTKNRLPGKIAIGHDRYATTGNPNAIKNVQPIYLKKTKFGPLLIAHNGDLMNSHEMREELIKKGIAFKSTTDTEIFGQLIANSEKSNVEDAIIEAAEKIPSAYSFLIMTTDKTIALRDRFGVRPLSISSLRGGYLVCSESFAFDQYEDSKFLRDVKPGEMIIFEKNKRGFRSRQYAESDEHFCIFEGIYFSNPRSKHNGCFHEDFRQELGKEIAHENPDLKGDCIIPVLDSGKHAAIGLQKATGIPYKEYFLRVHNPPNVNIRSFTSPTIEEREKAAMQKLHLRKDKIIGKSVIVVDDSIVRAVTMKKINERLRRAGAKYITTCISAPPILDVCHSGMDFHTKEELAASYATVNEIARMINTDKLIYLSPEGLQKVVSRTYKTGFCSGCFGGRYPVEYTK